jgi:hypothetical protein
MLAITNIRIGTSAAFVLAIASLFGTQAQSQNLAAIPPVVNVSEAPAPAGTAATVTATGTKPEITPVTPAVTKRTDRESQPVASTRPEQSDTTDRWQFQLTPYLWLASLHGTTGTDTRQAQLDASFGDIFHTLKFAFMGTFEARRNRLGIVTDMQYVSLSDDKATPGPLFSGVEADVKTFIFDPEIAYRVYEDEETGSSIDLMGGMRIVRVSTELNFLPGLLPGQQVDASRTWVDAVAGLRFKAHLAPKVFVVGKFDLGGGGAKFTFQLFGGLGYEVTPKVALMFGYRDLDINYHRDNFVYDTSQRGPILGVAFRF